MHVKAFIKTVFNWLQPDWYQTNDNNVDLSNQFENVVLTEELEAHRMSLKATMELLKEYCYFKAIKDEGLLLTEKDKASRAEAFYQSLLECNFIYRGQLSRHIIDEIKAVVNKY
jgi:hypothetical protein